MSELKVYHCNEWHNEYTEFYIKSEADNVIAELEESHKMEVEQLLLEIVELKKKLTAAQQAQPDVRAKTLEGKKMIEPGKLNGHLVRIKEELRKAEAKHTKFCDEITGKLPISVKKALANLRIENGEPPFYADSILHEEICEALEAYQEGDKAHALQELAQCGAVILRMMDFIDKE